jgi:hypothetical protein
MSDYRDNLDAEVERADRRIKETGARVAAQISRHGPVTGRASTPNGALTVVVQPGGRLVDLEITGPALVMHPDQLAAELVKLAQQATRNANAKLHQSIRSTVSAEVADSLARLGIAPGAAADEYVDWVDVIRRQRG